MEELGEAMKQAGQEMAVEDLKDMIKAVDRNGIPYKPVFVKLLFLLFTSMKGRRK